MAGSVNKVILIGNLGRDPEIRRTPAGDPVASLSIATSESWRDKATGERKERTEWHRVVIFNKDLAKVAESYLRKGSKVYLEGQLQTRKWTDQAGAERYATEVVLQAFRGQLTLLDSAERPAPTPDDYGTTRTATPAGTSGNSGAGSAAPDFDDEIPF